MTVKLCRKIYRVYMTEQKRWTWSLTQRILRLRYWADLTSAPDILYMAPDDGPIEEKECTRDLGVQISTDLTFKAQIEKTVAAGSKMAGWALRTFRGRWKVLILTLLRSLIQPRLDYCSQLWSPSDQGSINALESVQRHFIDRIKDPALLGLNYGEKLQELQVYSQERRREHYQVCFLRKISQGLVSGYDVQWQWSDRRGRLAVPSPVRRGAPACVRHAKEGSLRVKGCQIFNSLPMFLRNENCKDVDLFKNHLNIYLASVPDQPTISSLGRAASSNSLLDQIPLLPAWE